MTDTERIAEIKEAHKDLDLSEYESINGSEKLEEEFWWLCDNLELAQIELTKHKAVVERVRSMQTFYRTNDVLKHKLADCLAPLENK